MRFFTKSCVSHAYKHTNTSAYCKCTNILYIKKWSCSASTVSLKIDSCKNGYYPLHATVHYIIKSRAPVRVQDNKSPPSTPSIAAPKTFAIRSLPQIRKHVTPIYWIRGHPWINAKIFYSSSPQIRYMRVWCEYLCVHMRDTPKSLLILYMYSDMRLPGYIHNTVMTCTHNNLYNI